MQWSLFLKHHILHFCVGFTYEDNIFEALGNSDYGFIWLANTMSQNK